MSTYIHKEHKALARYKTPIGKVEPLVPMERKVVQDMRQLEKDWVIIDSAPLCLFNIPASGNQLLPLWHAQLFLPCNFHLLVVDGGFSPYFSIHSRNHGICVLVGKEHCCMLFTSYISLSGRTLPHPPIASLVMKVLMRPTQRHFRLDLTPGLQTCIFYHWIDGFT